MSKGNKYQKIIDFLKRYEGFNDSVYLDGKGIPTIGYGFTDSALIKKGKMTKAEADARLVQEVQKIESDLSKRIKNWDMLSDDSKTALMSYKYNYPAGFKDTTRFISYWNQGDYTNAIKEVDAGMNDEKNPGLRKRRLAEQALLNNDPFLTNSVHTTTTPDGNKKMTFPLPDWAKGQKRIPMPQNLVPKQVTTNYTPTRTAPTRYDALNGAGSPTYGGTTPRIQDIQEIGIKNQKEVWDVFDKAANAYGQKSFLPKVQDLMHEGAKDYVRGILGDTSAYDFQNPTLAPFRIPDKFYNKGKNATRKSLPRFDEGTPTTVGPYNVYPSAVGATGLEITTPEINVYGQDKRPLYQRYDAPNSVYDPNAIRSITDWIPGVGDVSQGFDAVQNANGYGFDYILAKSINGGLTSKLASKLRSSMKYVGMYGGAGTALGWQASKLDEEDYDNAMSRLKALVDGLGMYANGKDIYIKPSKRGTFTAAAKKRGKSVQAFASQVLNNPGKYSKAMRKKAQFAKNASKWKH